MKKAGGGTVTISVKSAKEGELIKDENKQGQDNKKVETTVLRTREGGSGQDSKPKVEGEHTKAESLSGGSAGPNKQRNKVKAAKRTPAKSTNRKKGKGRVAWGNVPS